jgi:hypothetical protein
MIRAAWNPRYEYRTSFALLGCFITLSLTSVLAPGAAATPGAYEPNDTILSAAGPLANHQSYETSLETENDKDFFYFYVTSPSTPVTLSLRNLGGAPVLAYVGVSILDASGVPVGTAKDIQEGAEGTVALTLEPQKYFVEVFSSLDYGANYSLETGGGEGAFGPYGSIFSRCAAAHKASATAHNGLTSAEAKLQRATARVRRSLYSNRAARRSAQTVYRKAKVRVVKKRSALEAARRSQQPWCSIPQ